MTNCIICNIEIETFDVECQICGSLDCELKSRTLYLGDNYVSNFIKNNEKEALFLLTIAEKAINNSKYNEIFSPIPYFDDMSTIEILSNIKLVLKNIKIDIKNIIEMNNDLTIFDSFGIFKYGTYKYILKSNLIEIKNNNMFKIPSLNTYEVNHYDGDILEFNKELEGGSCYLFHGSSISNWYSIMLNGLQIYSNTPRMSNGASYGKGIYLSSSFAYSQQYSIKNSSNGFILGVFLISDNIEKYKKAQNIYVVNDVTKIQLKYILWNSNKSLCIEEQKQITNKFGRTIVNEKIEQKTYFTGLRNKRLMKEIQYVMGGKTEEFGLKFEINDSNMYIWKIYISKIDEASDLYKDMKKMNIEDIQMEIRFENTYPISPPFVRIIKPQFLYKTGNITVGGSICMELLTSQGWSPACSIESLLIQIKSNILETGRLDFTKKNIIYTYEESQIAFKRMLFTHGWK